MPIEYAPKDLAEEDFLAEIKSQFKNDLDSRKTLDNKANTMITVASGVSTLLIAIGTFLITRIVEKTDVYSISIGLLAAGIIAAAFGILSFIVSYSVRNYTYAVGQEHFYKGDKYQKDLVERVRNLPKRDFNDRLFKGYLDSIRIAAKNNKTKAKWIKVGQVLLLFTIADIAALVGFILVATGSGWIRLQ